MMLQKVLKYCPTLNPITGSVTASLLMCQLEYWFDKTKNKPFYKFLEPCTDEYYKVGDSWVEELGFSIFEFRTAFSKIGKVYKSKTEYLNSKDKFEGKFYLSYRDRIKKRTYYVRNTQAISQLLLSLQSQCGYSQDYSTKINSPLLSDDVSNSITDTPSDICEYALPDTSSSDSNDAHTLSHNLLDTLYQTPSCSTSRSVTPYEKILELFHQTCPSLPTISMLTPQCKKKLDQLWIQLERSGKDALHTFKQVFAQVEISDFLCGRTPKSTWRAVLGWIIQPKKFFDILSGKYAPFSPRPTYTPTSSSKPVHTFLRMENHHFDLEQLEALERDYQQRQYETKLYNLSPA